MIKEYFFKFSPFYAVQCLILLKFYCSYHHALSEESGSNWELHHGGKPTFFHLFILKTYYYERSKIYGTHKNPVAASAVSIVNLPASNQDTLYSSGIQCVALNNIGFPVSMKPARDVALLFGVGNCEIYTHRIVCDDARPVMAIRTSRRGPLIKLNMTPTDDVSRNLVVCASRMFAFERWHFFITMIELHRIHKVDLVNVHVQSVDTKLYTLMQYYEKSGFLRILASLQMPSAVPTLAFDPNTETHWNHQVVNYQACLYEFRENTEFIAFHDWDEPIMTPKFTPIYDYMKTLSMEHPLASSFVISRFSGYMPTLEEMHARGMNMTSVWRDEFRFSGNLFFDPVGKPILRPSMVESVAIHDAFIISKGTHEMNLSTEGVFIVHARDAKDESMVKRLHNPEGLRANFMDFISHEQIPAKVIEDLPHTAQFIGLLMDCYLHVAQLINASTGSQCGNVNRCELGTTAAGRNGCVSAENKWHLTRYKDDGSGIRTVVGVLMEEELRKTEYCRIHF